MKAKVTKKGQVTIPAVIRRKHHVNVGATVIIEESPEGIVLKVVPRLVNLVGVDAGKMDLKKSLAVLDKMRSQDRTTEELLGL